MQIENVKKIADEIINEVDKIVVGKNEIIELMLTAMLSGGHVLLEDVPGTGKTTMAKTLSKVISGKFQRIQFTPDLLPSDIMGLNYFNQKEQEFVFKAGPVFCNLLLADEINCATPRTQSSLLECMEEKQITIDGETRMLDKFFRVIATENPIETVGTFQLPEALLDRFAMKIKVGYPSNEDELLIAKRMSNGGQTEEVKTVCGLDDLIEMQKAADGVFVHDVVIEYIVSIITATRDENKFILGASPRSSVILTKCAKAYAAIKGREYVTPEDVKYLAKYVLGHRIIPVEKFGTKLSNTWYIDRILEEVQAPVENFSGCQGE